MANLAFNSHLDLLVGTNYVRIAEITAMAIAETADDVNITNHSSTDRWHDYLQGLKTAEVSFEGNFLPLNNTHDFNVDGLLGLFDSGGLRTFKLHAGAGINQLTFTFYGLITNFTCGAMFNDKLTFSTVIRAILVNNATTFTPVLYNEYWEFPTTVNAAEYFETFDPAYVINLTSTYTEPFNFTTPATLTLKYLEGFES